MTENHLITGIPRSGTTLLTSLLSQSTSIVFSEPEWLKDLRSRANDSAAFTSCLIQQIAQLRQDVKDHQPIMMKASKFGVGQPSNYYVRDGQGQVITDDKNEQPFTFNPDRHQQPFVVKSNAQFTACLEELLASQQFKIFCVIRNPVAAVMSWRSLNIPVSKGNMKIAEKYSPNYLDFIAPATSLLEKQVLMADWYFSQYQRHATQITVIKYEDLIADPKNVLSAWDFPDAIETNRFSNKNKSKHYDLSEQQAIKTCFETKARFYQAYYPEL